MNIHVYIYIYICIRIKPLIKGNPLYIEIPYKGKSLIQGRCPSLSHPLTDHRGVAMCMNPERRSAAIAASRLSDFASTP